MPRRKAKPASRGSKSDFIRALPGDLPAKDVVAKAKDAGLVMTEKYVYEIRSASHKKAKRAQASAGSPAKALKGKRAAAAAPASTVPSTAKPASATMGAPRKSGSRSVEELLRAVASELGLSRAIAILEAEQKKVHALLAGR